MLRLRHIALLLVAVALLLTPQDADARKKKQRDGDNRALTTASSQAGGKESRAAQDVYRISPAAEEAMWNKCGLPKTGNKLRSRLLKREGYTVSYNDATLLPNWVAWRLTPQRLKGNAKRAGIPYIEDNEVAPRQELQEWNGCGKLGFDHGHMCPAGDSKYSAKAMEQTFLLTNMCPQNSRLNQETWERLESACRKWVQKLDELYIVCGPIFKSAKHKKMGKGNIHVPDAFYKVILYMGSEPRAIGFVYDNADPVKHDNMQDHVVPISEIEKITGITFFPALPAQVAARLKNVRDFKSWNKF